MEKKGILKWREHLIKMFGVYHSDEMRHTDCPLCGVNLEKISDFMIEELDKAREEGYKKGVKDGIKGKVFNKVEIKEEAHIPKELVEKIREEGILEVLAMLDDYNHPLTFTAEYVREQIIKLLEEENGKEDAR